MSGPAIEGNWCGMNTPSAVYSDAASRASEALSDPSYVVSRLQISCLVGSCPSLGVGSTYVLGHATM